MSLLVFCLLVQHNISFTHSNHINIQDHWFVRLDLMKISAEMISDPRLLNGTVVCQVTTYISVALQNLKVVFENQEGFLMDG